ncbi:MAG: hypothetical protein NUV76_08815 [Candidatus Kuenenia sp.]|nr:hypothetical protein [Candidatus Kuenenia sp.]
MAEGFRGQRNESERAVIDSRAGMGIGWRYAGISVSRRVNNMRASMEKNLRLKRKIGTLKSQTKM